MNGKPCVISIDPPLSRDLDDAIHAERQGDGWILDVCIPDVPSLLEVGSPEDMEARRKVLTRYGGSFIKDGMLSEAMVASLSLSPHRRTPMCWFRIVLDSDLRPVDVNIRTIKHRTDARLTYLEADGILKDSRHPRHRAVQDMWELAMALHARRRLRTGAAFDPERHVYTTEDGIVAQLSAKESHQTHLLVMEIMILANEALALHAQRTGAEIIYRNHVPREASSGLREEFVREMQAVRGLSSEEALERLRHLNARLGAATFGVTAQGHWGLDVPAYAWFTSPLRRYCDVVNLRAIVHGMRDGDAVATARHIDETMRTAKEASSMHHGFRSRSQIARQIAVNDLKGLDAWDVHTIMRACNENGIIDPIVDTIVRQRMAEGRMTGKDIESVFVTGRDVLDAEVVTEMTQWLLADRQRQFVLAKDMVLRQRIEDMPRKADGTPDTLAAMRAVAERLGIMLPEFDSHEERDETMARSNEKGDPVVDHPNPKGALLELATARKADVSFEQTGRVGPSHDPRFTVKSTWTKDGDIRSASASASNVKLATKASAWTLLQQVEDLAADHEPTVAELVGKPAKSALLEHAAKHRGHVVFTPAAMTGPPHRPTFQVAATYRKGDSVLSADGAGSSRKEAEAEAAARIIAQL